MAERKPKRTAKTSNSPTALDPQWLADVQQLSYRDAQTALDLALAQLQSRELEVEEMAGLYRRAEAYADRCQAVLDSVQQEVSEWNH